MAEVTLVSERLAERGREFVFHGPADGCTGCPYRDQCLNLTEGRRYRITELREGAQRLPCAVHEDDVIAVEVEPTTVEANVSVPTALAGNKTNLPGPCPHIECPSHEYCVPDGLRFDNEYRIAEIHGDPPHDVCHLNRELTLVEMDPTDG